MSTVLVLGFLVAAQADASFEWQQEARRQDPGYTLYREGYRLILDERWGEARARFEEMLRRFPASNYVDDARFWTAYSWKSSSAGKALEAYRRFIREFPRSNYFDDAVAEYQRLGGNPLPAGDLGQRTIPRVAYRMAELERELARLRFETSRSLEDEELPRLLIWIASNEADSGMQATAIMKLSRNPRADPKDLATLFRSVARDTGRSPGVREVALFGLQRVQGPEAVPFLERLASEEPNEWVQQMALQSVSRATQGDPRSFDILSRLYYSLPAGRLRGRETLLYAIASIGSEASVGFLAETARQAESPLRQQAVFYLGTIGSDSARKALLEILRSRD